MGKHPARKNISDPESQNKKENGLDLFSLFSNININETLHLEAIKEILNKTDIVELMEKMNKYNVFVNNIIRSDGVKDKTEILNSLKTFLNTDRKVLLETLMQLYFASRFNSSDDNI